MHADSFFIRRLTIVREQGDAWSARLRAATDGRRRGGWASIRSILIAAPALLFVGAILLIALAFVLVLGTVAITIGLAAAAFRWARRALGLGGPGAAGPRNTGADVRRVNVRVVDRA